MSDLEYGFEIEPVAKDAEERLRRALQTLG